MSYNAQRSLLPTAHLNPRYPERVPNLNAPTIVSWRERHCKARASYRSSRFEPGECNILQITTESGLERLQRRPSANDGLLGRSCVSIAHNGIASRNRVACTFRAWLDKPLKAHDCR
jgi:hypothetical protein